MESTDTNKNSYVTANSSNLILWLRQYNCEIGLELITLFHFYLFVCLKLCSRFIAFALRPKGSSQLHIGDFHCNRMGNKAIFYRWEQRFSHNRL